MYAAREGHHAVKRSAGFTLIELVMTLVLVGALAVFALPKMVDTNAWQLRAFGDDLQARSMQMLKLALNQRRPITATITGSGVVFSYTGTGTPIDSLSCPSAASSCIAEGGSRSATFNASNSGSTTTSTNSSLSITVASGSYSQAYLLELETGLIHTVP